MAAACAGKKCIFKPMEERIIEAIVRTAFEKAKREHAVHSPFALSNHISDHSNLSSKTVQKLHKKYIGKDGSSRKPVSYSIDQLCKYLGYENYGEYYKDRFQDGLNVPETDQRLDIPKKESSSKKKGWVQFMVAALIGILVFATITKVWFQGGHDGCMSWADTLYVKLDCDLGPYSEYGTNVVPLDEKQLKNFRKVKVDMSTEFFSEQTGKPLIWYSKKDKDELEYFTAPGLHPVTGETLKGITEYIIDKYVPVHRFQPDSFLGTN